MEISENIRCLFSAQVEERDGSYVVEVPKREVDLGSVVEGSTYRVSLVGTETKTASATQRASADRRPEKRPPVEEGESRTVEIEDIGDQGDGITRVERGFVVIVPDTDRGERVRVEITDVQANVAFAEVVERISYYE